MGLSRALAEASRLVKAGTSDAATLEKAMRGVLDEHGLEADYAAVRDPHTLAPVERATPGQAIALLAARAGTVRLIDNRTL